MIEFENRILKDLYESVDGLFTFTLHSRYGIDPDKIFKFINKYEIRGILIYNDDKISLSQEGRDVILKKNFLVKSPVKDKFKNIPNKFKSIKLEINKPFLPDKRNVSVEILKS